MYIQNELNHYSY